MWVKQNKKSVQKKYWSSFITDDEKLSLNFKIAEYGKIFENVKTVSLALFHT